MFLVRQRYACSSERDGMDLNRSISVGSTNASDSMDDVIVISVFGRTVSDILGVVIDDVVVIRVARRNDVVVIRVSGRNPFDFVDSFIDEECGIGVIGYPAIESYDRPSISRCRGERRSSVRTTGREDTNLWRS